MHDSIGIAKPPKNHQKLILDLCVFFNDKKTECDHLALPEPNLMDGDQYSKQPDVLVFDRKTELNLVAIELEQKAGISATINKAMKYVDEDQVQEAFVIEYRPHGLIGYEINNIYRISRNVFENNTFSRVLGIDLADFFHV